MARNHNGTVAIGVHERGGHPPELRANPQQVIALLGGKHLSENGRVLKVLPRVYAHPL